MYAPAPVLLFRDVPPELRLNLIEALNPGQQRMTIAPPELHTSTGIVHDKSAFIGARVSS